MRVIELALLTLALLGAVRPVTAWRRSVRIAIAMAAGTLLVATFHVLAEGPRWQMAPVYLVALGTAALATGDARRPRDPSRRRTPTVTAFVVLVLGGVLGWALPVVRLPEPGGPHPVGTTELVVVDDGRSDPYGMRRDGPRRLAVQLWYPAAPDSAGPRAPWTTQPRAFARNAAAHFDVPAFTLSHLGLVRSHAIADAPVGPGRSRPLLVYSHGWSASRGAQSGLLESLASRGFVVAAIDHTHASLASVFPDGRVLPLDPATLPGEAGTATHAAAARQLVETFADDIQAVLAHLRPGRPLGELADVSNVGLLGHSTGGGAAILACDRLEACNAVVGFDPWVEPLPDDTVGGGLSRPLLSLRSEEWVGTANDKRLRRLHAASTGVDGRVAIADAAHRDFTMAPLLSPLAADPQRVHEAVESWTVAFLRHHLDGARLDPLTDPPERRESTLER